MGPDALAQVLCHLPKFSDPDLLVGYQTSDDAAVYRIDEKTVLIQTVDIFPPVVDDPYQYGQIAAANALSDIYAMGGRPRLCLNICCFPEDLPKDVIKGIMTGGYEKIQEAGAIVAGGHSIKDAEPKYGLCVTGFAAPEDILTNGGAREGDLLILTKPLGTGILNTAAKAGLLGEGALKPLVESMAALNKTAFEIMRKYPVHGCTDVTGFGLLGHAAEMAEASGLSLVLEAGALPLLPEAREMARAGLVPGGAYNNRKWLDGKVEFQAGVPVDTEDICFDPQTSGGLLIALGEKEAGRLLTELQAAIPCAAIIGRAVASEQYLLQVKR